MGIETSAPGPSSAAEALQGDEDHLRQILDALPILAWTARPDGSVDSCNDRWCEYTGLSRDQSLGRGWTAALHPEDLAATQAAVAAAFGSGTPYQVEQRLEESRLRLAMVLEGSDLGAWDWVVPGDLLRVSRRWREIAGVAGEGEESTFPSAAWVAAIHPEDAARVTAEAVDLVQGRRERYEVEYRLQGQDGAWRWVRSSARAVVRDPAGTAVRISGTLVDVTDRKRAEEALQASAARRQTILETSMDGFWVVDLQGRLLEVNETYCRMSGYTAEELSRLRIQDLETVESARETAAHIERLRAQGQDRFESRHRRKDGSTFEVEVSVQFRPDGGGYMSAFIKDLTERRRQEEARVRLEGQLQQALKMESVGRLAGGIAHDFNNMLGVILGHAALALEQVPPDGPLRGDLEEIQAAAKRSADLTRQLLAFARKQAIQPVVLDLNAKVDGMLRLLQRILGEDIRLDWRPGEGLWPTRADPSQLDQILANLCANARDAIAGVGTLTIETGNVTLDAAACAASPEAAPGDYVRLAVTDTGAGMDRETLSHLFEPFFTTKVMGKGTGLGLATIYGIVKQSEGFIEVRSAPGAGTTFTIHLPRHRGPGPLQVGAVAPAEAVIPRGRETILLVEDEPGILRVTRRMLERQGYQVLGAAGPAEALRLGGAHAGRIDLLLTDVVMPELHGPDLADRLRALRPGLRCLFMSGHPADLVADQGVLGKDVHFLQKPFAAADLAAAVRQALGQG